MTLKLFVASAAVALSIVACQRMMLRLYQYSSIRLSSTTKVIWTVIRVRSMPIALCWNNVVPIMFLHPL